MKRKLVDLQHHLSELCRLHLQAERLAVSNPKHDAIAAVLAHLIARQKARVA